MSDDNVLVPRDLIRRLIFSGALLAEDELEEEVCALMTQPSDGALTWHCRKCRFEQPTDSPCDVCGGATESDGALTNDVAEPAGYECLKGDAVFLSYEKLGYDQSRIPLYRHPPKVCTCPSGDGSLRWPCPVHPPEVNLYTCIGKGGRYEILGLATGAGLARGEDRLVYRDASTGRLFLRTEQDFAERMIRLDRVKELNS